MYESLLQTPNFNAMTIIDAYAQSVMNRALIRRKEWGNVWVNPAGRHEYGTADILATDWEVQGTTKENPSIRTDLDYHLICPNCGNTSDVDPAELKDDAPMPYCKVCEHPLIDKESNL